MSKTDALINKNSRAASIHSDQESAIDEELIDLPNSNRPDSRDGSEESSRRIVVEQNSQSRCCHFSRNYLIAQFTNSFFVLCGLGMVLYSVYDHFIDPVDRDIADYVRAGAGSSQLILGICNLYNTEKIRSNNIIPIKGATRKTKTEIGVADNMNTLVHTRRHKSSTSENFSKSDDEDPSENLNSLYDPPSPNNIV